MFSATPWKCGRMRSGSRRGPGEERRRPTTFPGCPVVLAARCRSSNGSLFRRQDDTHRACHGRRFPEIPQLLRASDLRLEGLADYIGTLPIARQDETVVASAALELYRDGALLLLVAVAPGLRGQGVGRQMTQAAINLARERGLDVFGLADPHS